MFVYVEGLTYIFLQVINLFVALDTEVIKDTALAWIEWYPEELFLNKSDLRDW